MRRRGRAARGTGTPVYFLSALCHARTPPVKLEAVKSLLYMYGLISLNRHSTSQNGLRRKGNYGYMILKIENSRSISRQSLLLRNSQIVIYAICHVRLSATLDAMGGRTRQRFKLVTWCSLILNQLVTDVPLRELAKRPEPAELKR